MRLLLDTHVILWLADGGQRLNPKTFAIVAHPMNDRVVSDVSLWEIAIKRSTGKLIVNKHDIDQALEEMAVEELPISRHHVQSVSSLPFHHRDLFDRLDRTSQCRKPGDCQQRSVFRGLWHANASGLKSDQSLALAGTIAWLFIASIRAWIVPPPRWITAANCCLSVTAMLIPAMTTSAILYVPFSARTRH